MKTLLVITCLLINSVLIYSQQANDYFPSQTGFEWKFKATPLDSVSNPINSLAYFRMDSFASIETYEGKLANIVLTKSGPLQTILLQPYSDSLFYHTDGTNGFEYFNISNILELLLELDSLGIDPNFSFVEFFASLQDWYPVYQFASTVNTEYLLKQVDTSVFISPFTIPVQFKYLGTRLQDETIQTVLGNFDCKKFLTQWKVSAFIFAIEFNLLTTNDTIWIAPDNWIVQDIIPGQYVDLDSLPFIQIDPLSIPGLETKLTDEIVSVESNKFTTNSFVLEQNYPNPFNPSTTLKFSIPVTLSEVEGSFVTLKIYNALGEEVAVLLDKELTTGTYEVEWNAGRFTSGIYFYQLRTEGYVETKKMILIK